MRDQQLAQSVNSIVSEIPGSDGESPKNIPGEENVENVDSLVDFEDSTEPGQENDLTESSKEEIKTFSATKGLDDDYQEPSERIPTQSSGEPNKKITTLITEITDDINTIKAYMEENKFLEEVNKNNPAHGPK